MKTLYSKILRITFVEESQRMKTSKIEALRLVSRYVQAQYSGVEDQDFKPSFGNTSSLCLP